MGPFKLYRGFQALRNAPDQATAVNVGGQLVGVLGVDYFVDELAQYALILASDAYRVDVDAAEAMVDKMRARVPRDTGRLFNGISYSVDGTTITVTASAVAPRGRWEADYSRLVEFGTQARRQAVEASFFDDSTGAGRPRKRRVAQHPGTKPQPFFLNSAREVLVERRKHLAEIIGQGAS